MAKLFNLARMTVSAGGTGTITLGTAVSGFLTFVQAGIADGDVISYGIQDGTSSEVGTATYVGSNTTLVRNSTAPNVVTNSTNGGSAITVSTSAQVFITALAGDFSSATTTSANGSYTMLATDRVVASAATAMTGDHTWTLPAASALLPGGEIIVIDLNGVTGANTLSVARSGSDTINGGTSSITINTAYTGWVFTTNGVSKWTASYLGAGVTGTGSVVRATSPTLTTPILGVATVTSLNKLILTPPATSATLTVSDGKGVSFGNSLTFSGTDGSAVNAATGGTVLYQNVSTTTTVGYLFTSNNLGTISSGTTTLAAAPANYVYYTNNGAHVLAPMASDSALDILMTNGASAGSITFSGWTQTTNTGDSLTTTNASRFMISVRRINSVSMYLIKALQ